MKISLWRLIGGVVCAACLLLGGAIAVAARAEVASSQAPAGPLAGSGGSSMEWLTGGDEARVVREAMLASPEAVAERARSQTEFEGLSGSGAVSLAERTFGIQRPAWRGPTLGDPGAHIERYLGENEAAEVLPNGKHVVAQSTVPLRSAVGSGQLEPLSLGLQSEGGVYKPANPLVPVSISKQPAGGVTFPLGVSMTPVQAAEPEAASTVGDRVVYPGTAQDTDYMVEPLAAGGVEASWQLLSEQSPQENSLRFSLPAGASLQMSATVPGEAEVVSEGNVVLTIPPANAVEANGVTLPVSYSVSGSVLSTHVNLGGSVAYPVMVDPIVYGGYGDYGAGDWNDWKFYSNCGCINEQEESGWLEIYSEPGPANGDYGEWYIDAPGAGKEGGAKITRVWIDEMTHNIPYESTVNAEIGGEDTGSGPVWTNNGTVKSDTKPAPMVRDEGFTEDLEFCAQGEGGTGEELCNEEKGANYFDFLEVMGPEARTVDNYTMIEGAIMWYLDTTPPSEATLEDVPSGWTRYGPSPTWIHAKDAGTGIAAFKVEIPPGHLNEKGEPFFAQESSCSAEAGFDGCPGEEYSNAINFSELATGVYKLGVYAYDATGNVREETPDPFLYIDHTSPKIEPLSGSLVENAGKIGAGDYALNFDAVDGSESAPQSGVRTIVVAVDGTKVDEVTTSCPEPTGTPAANCFALNGSWTMEGERYGAGPHTVTVTAKDWLGNEATETLHVTSDEAAYTTLGPGAVNLQTGNFRLAATDVQAASPGSALTLSRSYESRNPNAGAGGPLGPQWMLSLPDGPAAGVWQSLHVEPDGNVEATLVNGARLAFARNGSSFTSPAGYQTATLSGLPSEKPTEYKVVNAVGDATIFTHAEHEEEGLYTPSGVVEASGAGGLNKVTYSFEKTSEGVTRPTKMLAPPPAGVSCSTELVKGCRELTFNYAETTTATGEGTGEWGDYKGRLTRVYLHTWNPKAGSKGEMTTTTVVQYAYDAKGRLRAEWNPQISPMLKTVYGYDSEGHVTAITAPRQETWALTYGSTASDANPGHLLKALQAPASTTIWKGEAITSTEAPALSGSPVVGVRMAVSQGKWSGGPVAYGYRWEDCNSSGAECTVINGATNANYTPTSSDVGHSIVGQILATNGGGTVAASSSVSAAVVQLGEAFSETKLSTTFECPHDIALGTDGNMWFTDACAHQVGKITPTGETTAYNFASGVCLGGITGGPDGNMWAVEECTNRIVKITTSGTVTAYNLPSESHPTNIVAGPDGNLWFTDYGTSKIGKITTSGTITEYSLPSYSDPYGIAVGADKNLWFTDWASKKIGKITTAGTVTEYALPNGSYPYGIAAGSDGNLWFTDEGTSKIGKITTAGAISEYAIASGGVPLGIASGPEGDLRFAVAKSNKIGQITTSGTINEYPLPSGSNPVSIANGGDANHVWFTEEGTNKIGSITTNVIGSYKLASPFDNPHYTTLGPDGNVWFTDNGGHEVGKITPGGLTTAYSLPSGAEPAGITTGSDGNVWAAEQGLNKIAKLTTGGTITEYSLPSGSAPIGIASGPDKNLWVAENGTSKVAKVTTSGTITEYSLPSGSQPYGVTSGPEESLWITEAGTSKIAKVTTGGTISEHSLPAGSRPAGIVEGPDGNLWITEEGSSKIAKMTASGTVSEYSLPSGSAPIGIASGADGNLWVTELDSSKIAKITTSGTISEYPLPSSSSPFGIVAGPAGELWFAENGADKIGTITPPATVTQAEAQSPQPGATVEYNVPVSGVGAAHEMGTSTVAEWAQKDDPVSATAIFPPDKPQSWPASNYERATVYYLDSQERTVNLANPAGGISTTEYNTSNDNVERTLTADDRATALKESKTAEVAEHLSTESKYNSEGTELTSTLGPEHKVKLSAGEEVQARKHTIYSYDEGAPSKGGPYYLVTKTNEAAKLADGEEKNQRAVTNSYAGQEGLGWELGEETSTTTAQASVDQIRDNVYNKETGSVVETRAPGGNAETVSPPVFASVFGKAGSGEGQFKEASAVAVGSSGEIWADDRGDGRIEKFSSGGSFEKAVESKLGKFSGSWGMAVSPKTGDVFVADSGHNTIVVFKPNGEELRSFGSTGEGALSEPTGISVTPTGEVWVADYNANKVEEFTEEGKYVASVGEGHLKEPGDVSVENGDLYVTSEHNVVTFTHQGEYTGSFGSHGTGPGQFGSPTEIVAAPGTGDLFVVDGGNERVEEFNPAGKFLTEWGAPGSGNGEFSGISGLAIGSSGTIYTSETGGDRIQEFTPAQAGAVRELYSTQWGSDGSGHGEFLYPGEPAVASNGDVFVTDNEADDLQKFTDQGKYLATFGSKGEGHEQMEGPTGLTVNQSTGEILVAECANDRVQVLNAEGKYVREFGRGVLACPGAVALDSSGDAWVADSDKNRIVEYGPTGTLIATYGSTGTGHVQFNYPSDIKVLGSDVYVSDTHNDRVEILNLKGEWVGQTGSEGNGGGQFNKPEGISFNSASDLFVLDAGNNRIEEFNPEGHFLQSIATHGVAEGQLNAPQGIAVTPAGDIYVTDAGNHRIEKWTPDSQAVHDSKVIYYTAGTSSEHPSCGEHAEWANMPCRTEPAAQPETEGLPELPVTTYEYNFYNEPTVTKTTSGSATRTETDTYDAAGRLVSKELTSTVGAAVPKVTYSYNSESGFLEKQTAGEHTITGVYNTLGQLTGYTDGEGGTSTYKYDVDGRTTEESTPYGSQTYTYNETTGLETKLVDSAAGTFTATYDTEGNLASETLPNGMTACYAHNATGEATGLEYRKAKSCESGSVWFSDSVTPTSHEQWATQTSSLSGESYAYDEAGRLTEVQETPAGKGCTVRLYGLDEEGNRTSLTTRQPLGEGKCATEGGTVARHTYDPANRLTDEGVEYNPLGDITSLPAPDAGSSTLESAYYADGQLAEQRQEGVTLGYQLDPGRRTSEITTTSSKTASTLINHYAGEGATPAWTTEPGGKWTRYIYSIGNGLAAIQTDAETPVLQLSDLHGDIIGTAADEETATKLLSSTNSTEYGVPTVGSPPRYSWLGTQMLPTEFPSGVSAMGARSYVPQLGRFLQPDPQPGGSANAYAYTHGNPINETDPSGEWTLNQTSGGLSSVGTGEGEQLPGGVGIAAGAIMPPPVNAQLEAAFWASPPWDQETAGNEEYEEYEEEEEGEEEYIGSHEGPASSEAHTESGILWLEGGEASEAGESIFAAGGCPSTHDPCYPKKGKSGKPNEGGTGSCRSGGKRNKKGQCEEGKEGKSNGCAEVGGALGGFTGGAIGGAVGGPPGAAVGGAIGAEGGSKAGEAACSG
jgi:RHS repeat-associated protein